MRREMKLIHMILAFVEKARSTGDIPIPEFDNYSRCEIEYHIQLSEEARFLDVVLSSHDKKPVVIRRMTWLGHEELERSRQV